VGNVLTVNFISIRRISVLVIGLYSGDDASRSTVFTALESSVDGLTWREMLPPNSTRQGNFAVHLETPHTAKFIRMSGRRTVDDCHNAGIVMVRFQAFGNFDTDPVEAIAAPAAAQETSSSKHIK
jgi:hypothetical protein